MSAAVDQVLQAQAETSQDRVYDDQDYAKHQMEKRQYSDDVTVTQTTDAVDERHLIDPTYPSPEQKATLRRVPGSVNLLIFTVAFVEFAERFSYYGSTVVFTNFIQQPLPEGSTTGAIKGLPGDNTPGALGKGQQAAFGITTFNTFWIYTTPILGAIIADMKWGRYKTICISVAIAIVGHVLLVITAIPSVITKTNTSYGILIAAIIIMGLGTGTFKSNISPLIAEQTPHKELKLKTMKSGEVVIIDPALTVSRIMMYFYILINLGALSGQIGMVYAEQDIGFWLSYTLPTIILALSPLVLWWGNSRYTKTPPAGSVFFEALRLMRYGVKTARQQPGNLFKNLTARSYWDNIKPSALEAKGQEKPNWMTFDDLWVEQVRRGLKACQVFVLIPFYWVCYNQMTGNLTSQAATMTRNVPNDLINNLNPISLVIMIPIMDQIVYPSLRKARINFTPIKKIAFGFQIAALSMMVAAVTQHFIYQTSPCGYNAGTCDEFSPLNVWIQTPAYVLIGISEIFTSIVGLEYAFTKAPENMRSFVTSMWLFTNAVSAALGQAFVALSTDPLLVWNYSVFAVASSIAGIVFWFWFRHLDSEEHRLNDMRIWKEDERTDVRAPAHGNAPAPADEKHKAGF